MVDQESCQRFGDVNLSGLECGQSGQFDISRDGTYFIMVEADPDASPTQLQVVLNWTEELKRLVPRN